MRCEEFLHPQTNLPCQQRTSGSGPRPQLKKVSNIKSNTPALSFSPNFFALMVLDKFFCLLSVFNVVVEYHCLAQGWGYTRQEGDAAHVMLGCETSPPIPPTTAQLGYSRHWVFKLLWGTSSNFCAQSHQKLSPVQGDLLGPTLFPCPPCSSLAALLPRSLCREEIRAVCSHRLK